MTKSILLLLLFAVSSSFAFILVSQEGRLDNCATIKDYLPCLLISTTSTPGLAVLDSDAVNSDDSLIELIDEVNGEINSQEMIQKFAVHFQVTGTEVIDAVNFLQSSTDENFSFESLNRKLTH